jgi:hypothetical protein
VKNILQGGHAPAKVFSMTLFDALELVGGLSKPSKMPCLSWSTPAKYCKTGAKLAKIKGSVCSKCYAVKGFYRYPNVEKCLEKRFQSLSSPLWTEAMTAAIAGSEGSGFFRWHDSGDIQSVGHLAKIVQIAKNLPGIKFWLPTREYGFVSSYLKKHKSFPENLTVRLSAYMIDAEGPVTLANRLGLTTSGVSKEGFTCPASGQGNKCLSCRACWDRGTSNINYKLH